jgi:hypothetical protein
MDFIYCHKPASHFIKESYEAPNLPILFNSATVQLIHLPSEVNKKMT